MFTTSLLINPASEVRRIDLAVLQRVIETGFAEVFVVRSARKDDIRGNPAVLRALTIHAVELLHGQLEIAIRPGPDGLPFEVQNLLNGSLAVRGRITHDDSSPVILDSTSEDLRGTRAETADEDDERTGVGNRSLVVVRVAENFIIKVADLNDRPFGDEEAGQIDGLGQKSPAVDAEIHDDSLDSLDLKVLEDFRTSFVAVRRLAGS